LANTEPFCLIIFSTIFATQGCGDVSNWRRISYRLFDEKLGKQGYFGGLQTLAIIFISGKAIVI